MECIELPEIPAQASRIGLGTWAIGGWMWGGTDPDQSIRTIRSAIDRGLTLIDTAPVYGFGESEALVGRAIKESGRRDSLVVSTKVALNWDGEQPFRDASRARINFEIDESLRRLQTDVIDIYHVHWPDPNTPMAETADALKRLKEAGKIRALGVSNFSPAQIDAFRETAPLQVVQPPYNLFEREIETELLPHCRQLGLTTLVYGAICRGLLSGKMTPQTRFKDGDLRLVDPKFQRPRFGQYVEAVTRLDAFAKAEFGRRVIHLALRWLLDQPDVSVALWGARRPDQLETLDELEGWHLKDSDRAEIDRIVAATVTDPKGPEFMAPPS